MIAGKAAKYMQTVYPFLFLDAVGIPCEPFATNQKVISVGAVAIWVSTIYYACASYYLYSVRDMGLQGIAYAVGSMFALRAIIYWLMVHCTSLFKKFDDCRFFSRETFTNIGPLLDMDIKSALMSIWGSWSFEAIAVMATYLGEEVIAAQTIIRSIAMLTFVMAKGYSFANKIFIGACVGAGKHQAAKMYYCVNFTLAVGTMTFVIVLQYVFKEDLFELYTHQDAIETELIKVWPMFLTYQFFEIVNDQGEAVIKGTGK